MIRPRLLWLLCTAPVVAWSWFDRVEPGAFGGQIASEQADALAGLLDLAVVLAHPRAHDLRVVPGGVVPDQQHGPLAARLGLLGTPTQEVNGHRADRAALDKAQPELLAAAGRGVPAARQETIAGQGFGVRVVTRDRLLDQSQRVLVILPGVQGRLSQPTPPHFILEAQEPLRMPLGQPDQTVAPGFFSRILRSGLVIHSLARRQRTPMRARVARMVSPLTRHAVRPRSEATSAANSRVHTPVGLSKSRGLWCSSARNASAPAVSKLL